MISGGKGSRLASRSSSAFSRSLCRFDGLDFSLTGAGFLLDSIYTIYNTVSWCNPATFRLDVDIDRRRKCKCLGYILKIIPWFIGPTTGVSQILMCPCATHELYELNNWQFQKCQKIIMYITLIRNWIDRNDQQSTSHTHYHQSNKDFSTSQLTVTHV